MRSFRVFIGVGTILFVVGIYMVLPDWPVTATYTDTVRPGGNLYRYYEVTIYTGGRISGGFSETAGHPVSFYVFDKPQYTMFQTNPGIPVGLFSAREVSSGSYSVSVNLSGTYYIVVGHGVGFGQSSQQVNITVTIDGTNTLIQGVGLAAIAIAVVLWLAGYDSRRKSTFSPGPSGFDGHRSICLWSV
ncbi:MAG: hypothetical protein AABX62_03870 [Thermoproteota archaeon]